MAEKMWFGTVWCWINSNGGFEAPSGLTDKEMFDEFIQELGMAGFVQLQLDLEKFWNAGVYNIKEGYDWNYDRTYEELAARVNLRAVDNQKAIRR